ncbi:MAG: 23S ribosomal protein [Parcubacteria group bacterium GW2011_GWA1_50_14]|nr:MAG: 23S ribosomal protein [Parcubacteria group bacterium GW2011_GWA1_50_14]
MERGYKNLVVWQKAKSLAIEIYKLTENFPEAEKYGITSQIRRAAISIPSNIAEGYRRNHQKEKVQFLTIAFGSGAELETQLEISEEIFLIPKSRLAEARALLEEIMKILNVLTCTV